MSFETGLAAVSAPPSLASRLVRSPRATLIAALVLAASAGMLLAWARLVSVWTTGAFFDTDDAMRMVQVRDLMAGQGWFDLTAWRLDPPQGVFMHWPRIVDVPIALLIRVFGAVADPVVAERLARLTFPWLLTIALFALLVPLCERLLGRGIRWPALVAAVLMGPATGQFEPGRIDHHSAQIVLLVACVAMLCTALVSRRDALAAVAGCAVAVSLGISVENIPLFAGIGAALAVAWICEGPRVGTMLSWFAAGLFVMVPLVYVATITPSRWMLVTTDALSLPQACAALLGAVYFAGLVTIAGRLQDAWRMRAVVAGTGVLMVGALILALFPGLVRDPFADLDLLVRALWLDHVEEAQPILRKLIAEPVWTIGLVGPALIGVAGAIREAVRPGPSRIRLAWTILVLGAFGGLAASCLMMRALSSVAPLAMPGALALAMQARAALAKRHAAVSGPFATALILLALSPVGWAMAAGRLQGIAPVHRGAAASPRPATGAWSNPFTSCTAPDSFRRLASL
jgi:hypothetical protein